MVSHRSMNWILTGCLLLTSCRNFVSSLPEPDVVTDETFLPVTETPAPEYVDRLRKADYQLGLMDSLHIVKLSDGRFEQGAPGDVDFISILMTDFTAYGDLNNDGVDEYVALVSENYGGSGTFVFLAVFTNANGKLVFQTSAWVDDRPLLNELTIVNGKVFLDAIIHKSDEPMCCPTLHTARHYQLINSQLDVIDYVTFTPDNRPRTIGITSPVNGTEVYNSIQIKGNVAIAPFENNLTYRILDAGGVELAIGSIMVSAPDLGAPGTFDETILLGNILSGAMIRVEVQDVSAQDGSLFAMDSIALVVK